MRSHGSHPDSVFLHKVAGLARPTPNTGRAVRGYLRPDDYLLLNQIYLFPILRRPLSLFIDRFFQKRKSYGFFGQNLRDFTTSVGRTSTHL